MSRNYGLRNYERAFRKAETEQDLHMQAEVARGYNQAGLWSFALVAFAALCYGWHIGWISIWPVN